ncbi:MAG: trimethylamine methyltransferase, partial [Desulfobacterales bacterium]|nr:trimethylamine methyltransferase [Desulfobacterales bacterium]
MLEKTMLIKMNQRVHGAAMFQVLSEAQIERIYYSALDVLELSGGRVFHEGALELFEAADAVVTGDHRVRIPISLAERAIASSPSKTSLSGRSGKRSIKLQKNEVSFGCGSDALFVYDRKSGERRACLYEDVAASARVVDHLPRFDFCMPSGVISDAPNKRTQDRRQFMALIQNCAKPLMMSSLDVSGLKDQWEMACLARGGEKEFRLNPLFAAFIQSESPLVYGEDLVEKLFFSAEKGIPAIYSSRSGLGSDAPASLAGALVQTLADAILAVVLCFLKKPGAPLVVGGVRTTVDEKASRCHRGAPELHLASAAMAEICKWLGLPCASQGGCSDAKAVDQQAASESVLSLYNGFLSGANLVHQAGSLDGGLTASLQGLVMCDEIIGMITQIGKGVEVTDESLALDVLQEVGPAGEFLTHPHTFDHFRDWFQPTIIDRSPFEIWLENGGKNYNERLEPELDRILDAHQPGS